MSVAPKRRRFRFRLPTPFVVVMLAAAIAWWTRERWTNDPNGPTSHQLVALDHDVLSKVLDDLVSYNGDDSPLAGRDLPPRPIVFATTTIQHATTIDEVLYRSEFEVWEKLSAAQVVASQEAAANLVIRTLNHDSIGNLEMHDKRVRIQEFRPTPVRNPVPESLDDRPIQAWPPGYSKDRRLAVIRLIIPWNIHHVEATYLLWQDQGKWIVCLRQFAYYV
jgi:hypothetical protein